MLSESNPVSHLYQVHSLMCTELLKLVDRITKIFPEIEAARPRCSSGIQVLCLLNNAIAKAKSLLQNCSESSKLYLSITGDVILSRCKKSCNLLEHSLTQVQDMVPVTLAVKISQIVDDLRAATFNLDSSEREAGKVVLAFLQQYASASDSAENGLEAIQFAAFRLNITSQKALLIEKRSIKKLLDKVEDTNNAKKQILLCFLNLLKKYGQLIVTEQKTDACEQYVESFPYASVEEKSHAELGCDELRDNKLIRSAAPPEEYKCPLSMRLMYDPVVIASRKTFERIWIQKWFDEGHDTCPKTKMKLTHLSLTPNTAMKELISKWCKLHGVTITDPWLQLTGAHLRETSSTSISSLSSSMNDLRFPIDYDNVSIGSSDTSYADSAYATMTNSGKLISDQISGDSRRFDCYNTNERNLLCLSELDALSWDSQCKAVKDFKSCLEENDTTFPLTSETFIDPLIRFLKEAHRLEEINAQKSGLQLLAFIGKCRGSLECLSEDTYSLLASFLISEVTDEALVITEVLSHHQYCRSKLAASGALTSILKILDSQLTEFQKPAMKILYNLSLEKEIHSLVVSLNFIPRIVSLLEDPDSTRYGLSILKNLCYSEDASVSMAESDGCIASVSKLLEIDSHEDQELAVGILLFLCSIHRNYCSLVMDEGVIPALVRISINGNDKGKASAIELLRLLRDVEYSDTQEFSGSDRNIAGDSRYHYKQKKSSSKATGFFGMKMSLFSKSKSLVSVMRR